FLSCARIGRLGHSSIRWDLGIFGEAGDLRATGEIVWVYADLAAKQSRPLPDWLRQVAEALQ
ncbi:MAG: acyl-CoA thioesterase, partial [Salinisphaeraceae bacterium]|nr:acyl-CoA thioesterase [Salinisphaeraceae bacterium]